MKKITLLILLSVIITGGIQAQTEVQKQIDKQYLNAAQKSFLYQVSPQLKAADEWLLKTLEENKNYTVEKKDKLVELSTDTTWSYDETRLLGDTTNIPGRYTHFFYNGDNETNYYTYFNQYQWYPDSAEWSPSRLQTTYRDVAGNDTTATLFYNAFGADAYYGSRTAEILNPTESADYETYNETFSAENGWNKFSRDLRYRNEFDRDTLSKTFYFNPEAEDYLLSEVTRSQNTETYSLYERKSYLAGVLASISKQEQSPSYLLNENRYFSEDMLRNGNREYTKIGKDFRYEYQVSSEYVQELMKWVGLDSLHFSYANDDSKTDAEGFFWQDSVWVLNQAYTSFQHELNGTYVADSVLIYEVVLNEETMLSEIGRVQIKTEMDYDAVGNQIEVRNYSTISDSLQINSSVVRTFKSFKDSNENTYYRMVKQESFARDFFTGNQYKANISKTFYDENAGYTGNSYFNLNAAGDTTFGYITQFEYLSDFSSISVRFEWDFASQSVILKNYRINNLKSESSDGKKFNQNSFVSIVNGEQAVNRSMNVYNSYPGIFNDGPIYAEMGDTLIYYVSARNPDLTIPQVEVENMPATATYDPETKRFFWIVDESNPPPMRYKATRGEKIVMTEVEFISDEFAVGIEEELNPSEFKLSQNFPNPFNPSTNIAFNLPASAVTTLKVYNMLGQEVATLVNSRLNSGNHQVTFDASQLSSGMYIYRLKAGSITQTKKMMLIK